MDEADETVQLANRKAVSERLRLAISETGMTLEGFAGVVGVPISSLKRWLSGTSDPAFSSIMSVAEGARVRLDWLATGVGQMRPYEIASVPEVTASQPADHMATDRELMGRCIDAINKLYQELNMKIPMVDMGREAADLHDEIAASGATGLEEQLGAIRFAIAQRRRAILTAPPSSKQQGSA